MVAVGRDNLGTMLTLTPDSATKNAAADSDPKPTTTADAGKATTGDGGSTTASSDGGASTGGGGADAGKPVDNRPLVLQAFSGTMHYLKIGKNNTILVRAEANGKTAQYKKVKSWCGEDSDCKSDVQNTGLTCANVSCTSKNTCACGN
jgi:hypothetical protein